MVKGENASREGRSVWMGKTGEPAPGINALVIFKELLNHRMYHS